MEIASTLVIAPLVFTFGELIPKNLYYRAPLQLLRGSVRWFVLFYRLFLPISFPLMAVTQLLQRFTRTNAGRPDHVLGRARLIQAGEEQEILDQAAHTRALLANAAHDVGELPVIDCALAPEIRESTDRGDGSP